MCLLGSSREDKKVTHAQNRSAWRPAGKATQSATKVHPHHGLRRDHKQPGSTMGRREEAHGGEDADCDRESKRGGGGGGVPPPGARPGARRWRLASGTNRLTKQRNRGAPGAGSTRPLDEAGGRPLWSREHNGLESPALGGRLQLLSGAGSGPGPATAPASVLTVEGRRPTTSDTAAPALLGCVHRSSGEGLALTHAFALGRKSRPHSRPRP